jgi:alpha-aminoadipic semialdehyde synthase
MKILIGLRREDKNKWEKRIALTPSQARELSIDGSIGFIVQPSRIRAFSDSEFEHAGITVEEDLSPCPIIIAIKEIPLNFFAHGKTYLFFSHTVKGQSYNMPMLKKIMDMSCQLIDYEKVVDENSRRLLFFGKEAGQAGMFESFYALGKRLSGKNIKNPFSELKQCYEYGNLAKLKSALEDAALKIKKEGFPEEICPITCGFAGYGNVSLGAQEIFDLLPFIEISPGEVLSKKLDSRKHLYKVVFKEEHMVIPVDKTEKFELSDYYNYPEKYESIFEDYIPHLTMLINCIYWDQKYPRLLTKHYLKTHGEHLLVIGDISCDINGAIECTVKTTGADNSIYVYDPLEDKISDGIEGRGIAVMAIDNLPGLLPLEASRDFGEKLKKFIPEIAMADYSVDFKDCNLSPAIKNAMIVYQGKLTPKYKYLEKFL